MDVKIRHHHRNKEPLKPTEKQIDLYELWCLHLRRFKLWSTMLRHCSAYHQIQVVVYYVMTFFSLSSDSSCGLLRYDTVQPIIRFMLWSTMLNTVQPIIRFMLWSTTLWHSSAYHQIHVYYVKTLFSLLSDSSCGLLRYDTLQPIIRFMLWSTTLWHSSAYHQGCVIWRRAAKFLRNIVAVHRLNSVHPHDLL